MKVIVRAMAIAFSIVLLSLCLNWLRPVASREVPGAENSGAATAIATMPELANYQQWPIVTAAQFPSATAPSPLPADSSGRTPVETRLWLSCIAPPLAASSYGPHFAPEIRVRTNDLAYANFANSATALLPEHSVVVKEKFATADDVDPVALGVMIKREPGYDLEGGDWEYAYLNGPSFEQVIRGRLENCRSCHASQSNADFLFRTHLKRE